MSCTINIVGNGKWFQNYEAEDSLYISKPFALIVEQNHTTQSIFFALCFHSRQIAVFSLALPFFTKHARESIIGEYLFSL